jgi:glycyl-tRNA synthetase
MPVSRAGWPSPPTTTCCARATPSTCSTRAAPSASPSAPSSSPTCATRRAASPNSTSPSANRLEFPWLKESGRETRDANHPISGEAISPIANRQSPISNLQSFLLELGSEELPPQDVVGRHAQIESNLAALLERVQAQLCQPARHRHDAAAGRLYHRLAGHAGDEVVEKRGPALDQAYDSGWASRPRRSKALPAARACAQTDARVRDNYVYAVKRVAGQPAATVLPPSAPTLLDSLRWGKTMRWNSSGIATPARLRWIVALLRRSGRALHVGRRDQRRRQPRPALCRRRGANCPPGGFTTFPMADAGSLL